VGLGILAVNAIYLGVPASVSLVHRFRVARSRRELERQGILVELHPAPEVPPRWPRWVAGFVGLAALLITTSAITAAPSARTEASTAGPTLQGAPTHETLVRPSTTPSSEHPVSHVTTGSDEVAGPRTSTASSLSPPKDPTSSTGNDAGAPSTVAALPTSATTIQLDWTAVDNAGRYDIERSINSVDWKPVGFTDGGQTVYTDDALSSGTTYYYRIVAYVEGQAAPSDAVSATTSVDTSIPPDLVSATGSVASVELDWNDLDGAVGYRIQRSPDGETGWIQIGTTGQDVTSYKDTGLASATTYYYRVVALTPDGDSAPSKALPGTTDAEAPTTSP
jgi:hypothetical protein